MYSLISILLTFLTLMTSLLNFRTVPQEKAEDFEPVLRFMACSDTHISGSDDIKLDRITKAVNFCYDVAESDQSYNKLDAVLFAGDLTEGGYDEQFVAFENTVKNCVREGTEILAIVAKNHDGYQSRTKSLEYCRQINSKSSDWHVVINGYHFIGLSACENEDKGYTMEQRFWLEEQLNDAVTDDPDKPVFVTHHEHVMNTVYGSKLNVDGWGNLSFRDILERYRQVVDISGHSHYPLNDPRSIYQGTFTAIGTGSMNYMEFTVDGQNGIHTDDGGENAQAWLIEVDADNRIRLRGFDVYHEEWLCDYLITDLNDATSYAYTQRNQKKLSSAPVFDNDAGICVKSADSEGKYIISVPAAKSTDGKPIFLYRISIKDGSGKEIYSTYKLNNYWTVEQYETISFEIEAKTGYTVSVLAENCYEMQSDALTYTF